MPAPVLVLGAIASVQTGNALARTLFDELGAAGVALLRLAIAALILFVVLRPKVAAWSRQAWAAAAVLGAAMAGMNVVFYLSLRTVPLGIAVTVEFVGPLLLALVQTHRVADLLWAMLALAGVALLGLDTGASAPLSGLALAMVAGLFWAGYIVACARIGRVLPGVDGLVVALAAAALLVLPFGAGGASAVLGQPSLLVTAAAVAGLLVLEQELGQRELIALALVSLASAGVTLGRRDREPPRPLNSRREEACPSRRARSECPGCPRRRPAYGRA